MVERRLAAMMEIVQNLRTPLAEFYNSLTDEQRRHLDALPTSNLVGALEAQGFAPTARAATLCNQRGDNGPAIMQDILQTVQLNQQQQLALDSVKSASSKAVSELEPSCPSEIARTIKDRLTAIDVRLRALVAAVNILRPAVVDFYAALDSEQKTRFNPVERTPEPPREQ
jgi:hypothetical protein